MMAVNVISSRGTMMANSTKAWAFGRVRALLTFRLAIRLLRDLRINARGDVLEDRYQIGGILGKIILAAILAWIAFCRFKNARVREPVAVIPHRRHVAQQRRALDGQVAEPNRINGDVIAQFFMLISG